MFQYNPFALLNLVALLITLWLRVSVWSYRANRGVKPFILLTLGLSIWVLGNMLRLSVTTIPAQIIVNHIMYLGIAIVPPAWLLFVLDYTGRTKWNNKRTRLLLMIHPILLQLAILTNPLHNLFWLDVTLTQVDGLVIGVTVSGLLFWVHALYSYILLLVAGFLLVRTMAHSPELYRGQIIYLVVGMVAPWLANIVFLAGLSPLPSYVDLTPLAFVITAMAVAFSMRRYNFLDIVPVARDAIIENMNDAVLVLDTNQRIVEANPALIKLINRPLGEVIGQPLINILTQRQDLLQTFEGVNDVETDIELIIDGEKRVYNLRISPVLTRQETVNGHIVVLHDITSLREVNDALKIANEKALESTRLKSEFLATMSHELRTPLNAIIGYSELQLEGLAGDLSETQHQYQERIFSNANNLLALINDILDISKIEAGRMELIEEEFPLRPWVDDIVAQNKVLSDEKGLGLVVDVDDNLPETLLGDYGRLRQVVVNLLSNAIKFTPSGQVTLKLACGGTDKWTILVSDTGIGIPPHQQETIFDEFRQVDSSASRQYQGSGLGLAIVRKLVLSMGGNIRVSSTLGQGSQFTVTLPLKVEAVSTQPHKEKDYWGVIS